MAVTISDGTTAITPTAVTGWASIRSARNVLHDVVESAEVSVTLRSAGSRAGTLEMVAASQSQAFALEALLVQAKVFTLTSSEAPALGMRFVASGDISVELESERKEHWLVTCDFRQVPA